MRKHLGTLAVLALTITGSTFASQTAPTKAKAMPASTSTSQHSVSPATTTLVRMREMVGTVASSDATRLMISRRMKGKNEETSFVLTPETRREGNVETGAQVMVKYRMENNERVATLVKVRPESHSKRSSQK